MPKRKKTCPTQSCFSDDNEIREKPRPENHRDAARGGAISAKEVRLIRRALNASQSLFAGYLNVSPNAVRSWEQGTRRPRQAALKLLMIAKKSPKALLVA